MRRGTGVRKAGHAGTLDPLASGVLLVLLGQAVRISEYLMDLPKTYRATVRLGVSTDTYDAEGAPTHEARPVEVSTRMDVDDALAAFVGDIEQTPPAYSAVKVAGQARAPARAQRRSRGARIATGAHRSHRCCSRYESPDVEIEVECGKGTYIRSLAHDLGQALGLRRAPGVAGADARRAVLGGVGDGRSRTWSARSSPGSGASRSCRWTAA